ncbi:putative small secreted protein [Staphylococcus epidermidis]
MKKLLTLISIILYAIVLTACGNDKSGNSYDSKKNSDY